MADQYFSENPNVSSDPKEWRFVLRENSFLFRTDNGVFSKAEVDFGSRTMIESFTEPGVTGDILDLGCGYGPVGIALAKSFPDRRVLATDINRRALDLAKHNAGANKINNYEVVYSDSFSEIADRKFAAILLNPPIRAGKETIYRMFDESYEALVEKGEMWIVMQKKQGAPSAKKKLAALFDEVELIQKNKGYYIYRGRK